MSEKTAKKEKEPLDATATAAAAEDATAAATKKKKKKGEPGADAGATSDAAAAAADADADATARFAEAKRLYSDFAPKLAEWGLPIDELNQKLMAEIVSKLEAPLKKLVSSIDEATTHGSGATSLIGELSTSVKSSIEKFTTTVPLKKLTTDLPAKLMELISLITAAINTPSLLLPNVSCGAGGALPDDLTQVAAGAAGVGARLFGQNERSKLWQAFVSQFQVVIGPLREALPQLQSLPELFDGVQRCLSDAQSGVKAVASLSSVQNDCRKLLKELISTLSEERTKSAGGGDVIMRIESLVNKAKGVDGFAATLVKASSTLSKAMSSLFDFFRSLEHLVMKISSIAWDSLFTSMSALHKHYPTAIAEAKKIMAPTGVASMFLKPSAYLDRITKGVDDIKALIDLDACVQTTQSAADGLLSCLKLGASAKSTAGPTAREMSTFSVSTLDPIRSKLDSLLSATKLQDILLGGGAVGGVAVLQNDVLGLLQKNIDTFSATAAKKLADAALNEANRLKDAALVEVQKMKDEALKMKDQILAEAAQLKATILGEADKIKAAAQQQMAVLEAQAAEMKQNAEKLYADAKTKAMEEIKVLENKVAALRADAELEVAAMKNKILGEAEVLQKKMLADATATTNSMLANANGEAGKIKSAAQAQADQIRAAAMKEVAELRAQALKEISSLKAEAMEQLKANGAATAGAMFKSLF